MTVKSDRLLVERKGLHEVYLETPPMSGQAGAERAWCWKYKVAAMIGHLEHYDKILFLDCDSLALRDLGELLEGAGISVISRSGGRRWMAGSSTPF